MPSPPFKNLLEEKLKERELVLVPSPIEAG